MSPTPSIFCMVATPFEANGSLDEEALRVHLRRMVDAGKAMANVLRLNRIVQQWAPTTARWVKMGMKVLGTGNGVLRRPYLLPPQSELDKMAAQFEAMKLRQIEASS